MDEMGNYKNWVKGKVIIKRNNTQIFLVLAKLTTARNAVSRELLFDVVLFYLSIEKRTTMFLTYQSRERVLLRS